MSLVHPAPPGPLLDISRDVDTGDKAQAHSYLRAKGQEITEDYPPTPISGACSPNRDSFSTLPGLSDSLLARIRLGSYPGQGEAVCIRESPVHMSTGSSSSQVPLDYCICNKGEVCCSPLAATVLRSGSCGRGCSGCQSRKAKAGCINLVPTECHQSLGHGD